MIAYSAAPRACPAASSTRQRDLLRALLGTYFGRVPDGVSPMAATTTPPSTRCSSPWAGPLEPGPPHYYRMQGPRLLIEWDNTQRNANHAHSVWRDPRLTSASTC